MSKQDSAIPLCFDCHGEIGRYAAKHPKGLRYNKDELKQRREQVYEANTRHLVPAVAPWVHQGPNKEVQLPRVLFSLGTSGGFPPAKARVNITVFLGGKKLGGVNGDIHRYYNGETIWRLNPSTSFSGNFGIDSACVKSKLQLRLQADISIIDMYEREHALLPFCYTYVRGDNYWFGEPTTMKQLFETEAQSMIHEARDNLSSKLARC